jgi:hypothetical protein
MSCKHPKEHVICKTYGYRAPIWPCARPDRRAHGAVQHTETCGLCGAVRRENSNGRHRETGPWVRETDR